LAAAIAVATTPRAAWRASGRIVWKMAPFGKSETGPEVRLRHALAQVGVALTGYPNMPRSPDISLSMYGTEVFVNACFWHGCSRDFRPPDTKAKYWSRRVRISRAVDARNSRSLRQRGLHVLSVWECPLRSGLDRGISRTLRTSNLSSRSRARVTVDLHTQVAVDGPDRAAQVARRSGSPCRV